MSLRDLTLLPSYRKKEHDIAGDFYLPCMREAVSYDRAVGFFSSSIFSLAWPELRDFVLRAGKMRLICSPFLSREDLDAIRDGHDELVIHRSEEQLRSEIIRLLADPFMAKPTKVLATLLANGVLELKIAFITKEGSAEYRRLFHDKVGIFQDARGNQVVFKGSMNETYTGLSADGNLESVDVFVGWGGDRDSSRVLDETRYFELLWADKFPGLAVRKFPEIAVKELLAAADPKNWPTFVDEICMQLADAAKVSPESGRTPLPHQLAAIANWTKAGRRGILEHATGSGKTFTALCIIKDLLNDGHVPIVFVPSELLLEQWKLEIASAFGEKAPSILMCGGGHSDWRNGQVLRLWTRNERKRRLVLSTMDTGCSDDFLSGLVQGDHLAIIADEVHRAGSPEHRKIFMIRSGPRLGLSATPRRYGDPDGTHAIVNYFGDVVPPVFGLKQALSSGVLVPYIYTPHVVTLADDEALEWKELDSQISRLMARQVSDNSALKVLPQRLKMLLIRRARIVKAARGKIALAATVIQEKFRRGDRWIVYCDSQAQMSQVKGQIKTLGINVLEYHSAMRGDKSATMAYFREYGGVLVAIKCLDEGVDIPAVSHALILASSRNPREFIQRRGRVLRRSAGKHLAFLHDAIVVPPTFDEDESLKRMSLRELARAMEFAQYAENIDAAADLRLIAIRNGIEVKGLLEEGDEDEVEH